MTDAAPKPSITLDGKNIPFEPGDTIMRAAERAKLDADIPRFCYHPGLPVAGTCRMCTVEIEKSPKLMTSCSTPATDGMIVHTQSEKVRNSRAGVMEFLLINHPLDCPVCDQAGECSLQDYNYQYGPGSSEFKEAKRVFEKAETKKLSERLTLNMNRCVHCERCVRFTENVTKTNELLMNHRGWKKELTTALEEGVFNEYQGNIADICPVGAITFNDFRFKKRVWFLKPKETICDGCAKGCSIFADEEHNIVYRYRARVNKAVNGHWICDDGRVSFHRRQEPQRIVEPMLRPSSGAGLVASNWATVLPWVTDRLATAKKVLVVLGTDSTTEEAQAIQQNFKAATLRYYNGVDDVTASKDDAALDQLLRRKDQTPNTRGLEALGLSPLSAGDQGFDLAIYFKSGRAAARPKKLATSEIGWGLWLAPEASEFDAVIPGLSHLEKKGSFTNCDGITQTFEAAVSALGASTSVDKVLNALQAKGATKSQEASHGSV